MPIFYAESKILMSFVLKSAYADLLLVLLLIYATQELPCAKFEHYDLKYVSSDFCPVPGASGHV